MCRWRSPARRKASRRLPSCSPQFAPRQSELDGLRRQIEDIQTRLRTGSSTLSDDEKARLSREAETMTRTFQRKQQDSQDDFNEAQREVVDRIGRKMIDVLDKYSKEKGYGVIFDTSAQNTPVATPQIRSTRRRKSSVSSIRTTR